MTTRNPYSMMSSTDIAQTRDVGERNPFVSVVTAFNSVRDVAARVAHLADYLNGPGSTVLGVAPLNFDTGDDSNLPEGAYNRVVIMADQIEQLCADMHHQIERIVRRG